MARQDRYVFPPPVGETAGAVGLAAFAGCWTALAEMYWEGSVEIAEAIRDRSIENLSVVATLEGIMALVTAGALAKVGKDIVGHIRTTR